MWITFKYSFLILLDKKKTNLLKMKEALSFEEKQDRQSACDFQIFLLTQLIIERKNKI